MKEPINFCRYIADIEADPKAITPRLTIRQWLKMKIHVNDCDVCSNRIDRVLASAPKKDMKDLMGNN